MDALVIGAGEIGARLARRLAERGAEVTVATRRGTGIEGARAVAVDAADAPALAAAAAGARTVYLVTNPAQYHRWAELWPPVLRSVLAAARGKDLVIMGNLYAYGRAAMPMTERSPLRPADPKGEVRRRLWEDALAAHERGELRAVEVRASDYFGPGAGEMSMLGTRFFAPLMRGRAPRIVGDRDAPHSWTYLDDIAATLEAAGSYAGPWGRAWHVPSAPPRSYREIAGDVARRYGLPGRVEAYPRWLFGAIAAVSPFLAAVRDSSYQFRAPFVLDAAETERELGVAATPWEVSLPATAESYR